MRDILALRNVESDFIVVNKTFTGSKFDFRNDLIGTMGDTVSFGFFMLISFVILLAYRGRKVSDYIIGSLFLILMFLSGSRALALVSLLLVVFYHLFAASRKNRFIISIVLLVVFSLGTIILLYGGAANFSGHDVNSFLYAFSPDYIRIAMNQRLGILVYLVPDLFSNLQYIVGFSADRFYFSSYVASIYRIPYILQINLVYTLEDVYWFALVVYYGVIGVLLWIAFLWTTYIRIKPLLYVGSIEFKFIPTVAITLLALSIPLNFFNQAFEAKSYSFYMWLFVGLAVNQLNVLKLKVNDRRHNRGLRLK